MTWQSEAPLSNLKARARLYQAVRDFFESREVLEVETPIIVPATTNEVFIDSITVVCNNKRFYLHASPEYAMKRLLAQHQTSLFQITKVFRDNEMGARHSCEFSMLEWYRVGFSVAEFITELVLLLEEFFPAYEVRHISYGDIFKKFFGFCPYRATLADLNAYIKKKSILDEELGTKGACLDLLFSMFVEPSLLGEALYFVQDYPLEQASMAATKVIDGEIIVADRFELFVGGMELANGYQEQTDGDVLSTRMQEDITARAQMAKEISPIDEAMLEAHKFLPAAVGASVGLDRLLMLYLGEKDISKVLTFKNIF